MDLTNDYYSVFKISFHTRTHTHKCLCLPHQTAQAKPIRFSIRFKKNNNKKFKQLHSRSSTHLTNITFFFSIMKFFFSLSSQRKGRSFFRLLFVFVSVFVFGLRVEKDTGVFIAGQFVLDNGGWFANETTVSIVRWCGWHRRR